MESQTEFLSLNTPGLNDLVNPLDRLRNTEINFEAEKEKKVARDFESIFIHQLLNTMKETIPESDLEDSSSKQVKSMFYSFLAQEVSDKGGLGLWQDIYRQMPTYKAGENVSGNKTQGQHSNIMDTKI